MFSQPQLINQIDQQKKIIQYLKEQHLKNTGYSVALPQAWSEFLDFPLDKVPILEPTADIYEIEKEEKTENFLQYLYSLNLPQKIPDGGKKAGFNGQRNKQVTTFDPNNKFHMVEYLNLSNFENKKFSKAAFKELLDSISEMRCLAAITLRNNGIDDSYLDELESLFRNPRITSIDISNNRLNKSFAIRFGKLFKEITHLEWLKVATIIINSLSGNLFSFEQSSISALVPYLRYQKSLYHISLDSNSDPDPIARLLLTMNSIRSLSLEGSKLNEKVYKSLETVLMNMGTRLISLNLGFCFLDEQGVYRLSRGLEGNRILIKLDLRSNALSGICGVYIVRALKDNITLSDLNLSKNCLDDEFALSLSDCLTNNDVLYKVDIGNNPIGQKGALAILKVLQESNDTIENMGDLNQNIEMGVINIQEIKKHLKINQVSKDLRRKILENKKNVLAEDPLDADKQSSNLKSNFLEDEYNDYKLFKPIIFTNQNNDNKIRFWNI